MLPQSVVEEKVEKALKMLIERDGYLLQKDSSERSITHRLAIYLEPEFEGWNVDCEYNRNGGDKKVLDALKANGNRNGRTVLPDIIIHKRGTKQNLLVIEAKKNDPHDAFDLEKLAYFKKQENIKYKYALYINIGTGDNAGRYSKEWI
ncbi:MAG: hypothetical protein ACM3QZ_01895 [Solirubrobacterales bacterium]